VEAAGGRPRRAKIEEVGGEFELAVLVWFDVPSHTGPGASRLERAALDLHRWPSVRLRQFAAAGRHEQDFGVSGRA